MLFVAAVVFNSWWDFRIWKRQINASKNTRNHNKGWWLKFGTCIPSAIFFLIASNFVWVVNIISVSLLLTGWFSLLFDGTLNIFKGEPFFWLGTEDGEDDAKSDNFYQSMPQWAHITLKLVIAFVTAGLYYFGTLK